MLHNIETITRDGYTYASYTYDRWNQLTAATHNGMTFSYIYDAGGNITSKTVNGTVTNYTYGDSQWKDLLTGYGSETFTYDAIGNPLTWRNGATMTWEGRRLATYTRSSSGLTLSFAYNADGIRTKKTVNGSTTEYTLDGDKIVRQKNGNQILYFAYDAAGNLYSMTTGGTTYYYVRNMQGDILGLNDTGGNQVASYAYDPWGNITSVSGSNLTIANLNPFRYRGYYYDSETGLYYLQSRYYDPVVGRFISADGYLSTGQGIIGYNMFAYCLNNPVNYKQNSVSSRGSITIPSISVSAFTVDRISASAVKQTAKTLSSTKSSGFNLFGYELRTSAGWDTSPYIATGFLGRIGFSSYVTHTVGQSGMLYGFAGSTSDIMNWFGTTYYAGIGINLFDIIGAEAQLETVGIGAQVSIGNFSIGANINLIGGTSITFGWDTDLENGMTRTDGFTVGVNTGCLVVAICWIYKLVTTGDPSPVPGLQPAPQKGKII